ncbi:tetratricopeptide repeat protein [Candidatus Desantisbacteria bacterium]|nr:tetratricopeptide repeat protein [Candidatus Desantisbacteria bacterium]
MLSITRLLVVLGFISCLFVGNAQAIGEERFLAKNFLGLGIKAYTKNDVGAAIYYFKETLKLDPNMIEAKKRLGFAYYRNGMLDDAVYMYTAVIKVEPNNEQTRNILGIIYYTMGKTDKAIEEYQKAINANPTNPKFYNNLGVAYYASNSLDLAQAQYQKALELVPLDTEVHTNLGAVYYDKGLLQESIHEYEKALKQDNKNSRVYFGLGVIHATYGNLKKARSYLNLALKYEQEYTEASDLLSLLDNPKRLYLNFADKYCRAAKYDLALELYSRVLKIEPNCQDVLMGMGMCYYQKAGVPMQDMMAELSKDERTNSSSKGGMVLQAEIKQPAKISLESNTDVDVCNIVAYKGIVQVDF